MGLFQKIQSKLELYRLEQKYARRKNRATFTTGAVYQDGEYFYTGADANRRSVTMSTNSTGNSNTSGVSATSKSEKRRTGMWTVVAERR